MNIRFPEVVLGLDLQNLLPRRYYKTTLLDSSPVFESVPRSSDDKPEYIRGYGVLRNMLQYFHGRAGADMLDTVVLAYAAGDASKYPTLRFSFPRQWIT